MTQQAEHFTPFDAASYLETEEDIHHFLEAAIDGNDAAHIIRALNIAARAQNMQQLARNTGMSRAGLYKALSGKSKPSFENVMNIMQALGLQLTVQPRT